MPNRPQDVSGEKLVGLLAIETPRLTLALANSYAIKKKAYHLIHADRMEHDLGLPVGLSWSRFVKPFRQTPTPRVYLATGRDQEEPVGVILLWFPSPTAWPMIHYGITRRFRGQGFATEAVSAAVRKLLDEDLVPGVGAVIAHSNVASAKVARASGFLPMHEQGDVTVYGVAKDDTLEIWMLAKKEAQTSPIGPSGWLDSKIREIAFRLSARISMVPYLRRAARMIAQGLS